MRRQNLRIGNRLSTAAPFQNFRDDCLGALPTNDRIGDVNRS
jgi:hypothetical protein